MTEEKKDFDFEKFTAEQRERERRAEEERKAVNERLKNDAKRSKGRRQ